MEYLVLWIGLSVVVGIWANRKGGNFWVSFLVSLLISPILGALLVAVHKPKQSVIEKRELRSGQMKKCPRCAELIKPEAVRCRYCGADLA